MRQLGMALLVAAAGCAASTCPLWGRGEGRADAEALAGTRAAPALEARFGGVVRDPAAETRMARVGRPLLEAAGVAPRHGRYRLLAAGEPNAVSLPLARVYITQGLYARLRDDAMLAAVIAHEAAHLARKDHFKARCRQDREALRREMDADRYAVRLLARAGYKTEAMIAAVRLISDQQPPSWTRTRIAALEESTALPHGLTTPCLAR
jgi:predicted Zn-dependent protease